MPLVLNGVVPSLRQRETSFDSPPNTAGEVSLSGMHQRKSFQMGVMHSWRVTWPYFASTAMLSPQHSLQGAQSCQHLRQLSDQDNLSITGLHIQTWWGSLARVWQGVYPWRGRQCCTRPKEAAAEVHQQGCCCQPCHCCSSGLAGTYSAALYQTPRTPFPTAIHSFKTP